MYRVVNGWPFSEYLEILLRLDKISDALSDPDRVESSLVMQSHCLLLDLSVRAPFT